jgi:hypothetical protein
MNRWMIVLALLALVGCEREKKIVGVDRWNLETTRLKDANGRCQPEELPGGGTGSYCFLNNPLRIRGMPADVDLYFDGVEPTSRLVLIQLKVSSCVPTTMLSWLRASFGEHGEQRSDRYAWPDGHLRAVADLPLAAQPDICLVNLLRADQRAWFDRLWKPADGAPAPAPAAAAP